MTSLQERFRAQRPRLEPHATEPTTLVDRTSEALDQIQGDHLETLNEDEARLAIPLLQVVRAGLSGPLRTESNDDELDARSVVERPWILQPIRLYGGVTVGAAALVAVLLQAAETTFWAWVALVWLGVLLVFQLWAASERSQWDAAKRAARDAAARLGAGGLAVNVGAYLDDVERALGVADQAIAATTPQAAPRTAAASELPDELLELLQDLWEDRRHGDAQVVLKRLEGLEPLLRRHGISLVTFEGGDWGSPDEARTHFEFEPSVTPCDAPITLAPAFLRGTVVLRRGRVQWPSTSEHRA